MAVHSYVNSCDSFQHNLAERHRPVLTDQKLIQIHRQIVTEGGDRTIIPSTSRRNPNDLTKSTYNRGTQILELEAYHAATVSPFQFSKELTAFISERLKVSKYQKQNTKYYHPPKNQQNSVHFFTLASKKWLK